MISADTKILTLEINKSTNGNQQINMVTLLVMSAKMATQGLLKRKVFWNKDYDVIVSGNDTIHKTLPRDSDFIVDMAMWTKFANTSISMREVIIKLPFIWIWPEKNTIFEGWSWFRMNSFGLGLVMV